MTAEVTPVGLPAGVVPVAFREALAEGRFVDVDGVRVRPPTKPGARGSAGQYRLDWTCPLTGKRRQKGATRLEVAWARAAEVATTNAAAARGQAPPRLDIRLGNLVEAYLSAPHAGWGESRRATVTSLLNNWVVHDRVTISRAGVSVLASDFAVGDLTPDLGERILEHARRERAHRTYEDVHRELGTLLRWAARENYLPRDTRLPDEIKRARPERPGDAGATATVTPLDPDDIPPLWRINDLRQVAGHHDGDAGRFAVDAMAYGGLRIGELLGLEAADSTMIFDKAEDVYRPYIWQRVHRTRAETRSPKGMRRRHAWLPPWMTPDVGRLLTAAPPGSPLVAAPHGGWWPVDRFRHRRFDQWLREADWPRTEPEDGRDRVWQWTAHSLRHHAASWMLNELGLTPDDVAAFLGHATGHQVWVLYARVMPELSRRASAAAAELGDPRP